MEPLRLIDIFYSVSYNYQKIYNFFVAVYKYIESASLKVDKKLEGATGFQELGNLFRYIQH